MFTNVENVNTAVNAGKCQWKISSSKNKEAIQSAYKTLRHTIPVIGKYTD